MTVELQKLVEAQAETIHDANKEIKRQKNSSRICEAAANSTSIQTETIVLLRSSLASALDFPQLNASNLEQLDVAPFMLELMESYNKQTETIRDLKTLLEKERAVEEHMSEVAKGLKNLTSAIKSASINLDIVDQQAQVIKNQGKSITQLTPFLRHAPDDVVWQQKRDVERFGVESVSTCSCLPRSLDSNKPTPVQIEYHCGAISNRISASKQKSTNLEITCTLIGLSTLGVLKKSAKQVFSPPALSPWSGRLLKLSVPPASVKKRSLKAPLCSVGVARKRQQ